MAKSRIQIQKESDNRRGVKVKGFKLPLETIAKIQVMSEQQGISGAKLVVKMTEFYEQHHPQSK
ncbi:MAG: ribbon-helix-helix protein, CopG family [Gammaproteobacteria bacterium]|nr:ribbon-helix-helix protein, CopG family [Gammaproteobacteria bacterium]